MAMDEMDVQACVAMIAGPIHQARMNACETVEELAALRVEVSVRKAMGIFLQAGVEASRLDVGKSHQDNLDALRAYWAANPIKPWRPES